MKFNNCLNLILFFKIIEKNFNFNFKSLKFIFQIKFLFKNLIKIDIYKKKYISKNLM